MTSTGLPHSEISGSTPVCGSPKLIAANHVLHRLLTPRHSPCALSSLATNLIGTLKGFRTSGARSGQAKPAFARVGNLTRNGFSTYQTDAEGLFGPKSAQLKLVAHHYFLVRYAVYKVETKVE